MLPRDFRKGDCNLPTVACRSGTDEGISDTGRRRGIAISSRGAGYASSFAVSSPRLRTATLPNTDLRWSPTVCAEPAGDVRSGPPRQYLAADIAFARGQAVGRRQHAQQFGSRRAADRHHRPDWEPSYSSAASSGSYSPRDPGRDAGHRADHRGVRVQRRPARQLRGHHALDQLDGGGVPFGDAEARRRERGDVAPRARPHTGNSADGQALVLYRCGFMALAGV